MRIFGRRGIFIGSAILAMSLQTAVRAAPILVFTTTPNPDPVKIVQNQAGNVTFTVSLSMATTAPITKGFVDETTLGNTALQFNNGDMMDSIGGGRLVPGGTCFTFAGGNVVGRTIFALGQSCTFVERFTTSDPRDPDPDVVPGNWSMNEVVNVVGLDANSNRVTSLANKVSFSAVVLDVPEPGSVLVAASAIAGLAVARRRRRPGRRA